MKKVYIPILLVFLSVSLAIGQIDLTSSGYSQNFNTLAATGTSSTLPDGWFFVESGTAANTTYTAGTGSANAGDTYSFGSSGSSERALGGLFSNSLTPTFGAYFTNNTGTTLTSLTISYTGEQWRLGEINGRTDRIDFQYSTNATSLSTGTWTDVNALDFTTPNTSGTAAGARNGNDAAYQTTVSATISDISIADGATFFIRWNDFNASGSDDGLAVDDFSISAGNIPVSPTVSVAAGTNATEPSTTGSFSVAFSTATTASTTFNYALTGTATFSTDYTVTLSSGATPSPLTSASGTITVPASTSSITVTVTPIDDTQDEGTETIVLTLSNPDGGYVLGTASATINLVDNDAAATRISTIQGSGAAAIAGNYTVEAIVTGIYPTLSPAGFYIQEEDVDADSDPNTSEGIFVVSNTAVAVGDKVRVIGTVQENGSTPSFNQAVFATATVTVLTNDNPVPTAVEVALPVTAISDFEKYEGMRIRFPATLTVSDNSALGTFGELKLSAGGLVYQPTQIVDPNDATASGTTSTGTSNVAAINALITSNNLRTITLDDGRGTIPSLPYVNNDNTVRVGSTVDNLVGIMGYAFSLYRIQPVAATPPVINHSPRPAVPTYGTGTNLKIASFNVLNYFNGNGTGQAGSAGGFPTSRGAHSLAEFNRQRDKIISAITQINADVVGLLEIENKDLNNTVSALQDLVNGLNAVSGAGTYSFINDDLNGDGVQDNNTDEIRAAIIYKSSVVTPSGTAMIANNAVFDRPALAQKFILNSTNVSFNFIVNHFKSKGGTGSGVDADQNDGQSAFNNRRKLQATALINFINNTVIPTSGTDRIISVGDYNAYYEEDPMDILRAANYTVASTATSYSYLFSGQVGSLDHAVLSPSANATLTSVAKWNANSVESTYLDYNDASNEGGDAVNPWADTYTISPWRASDHDAIVLGFNFPAILPITLTQFSAVKENSKSKISWTTTQEINTKEFTVERSANGTNWSVVSKVAAAGNSSTTNTYQVYDASPLQGTNFYRLVSADKDGKITYSSIVRILFSKNWQVSISPNPVKGTLYVQSSTAAAVSINVYDAAGRTVKQFNALKFAEDETRQLDISGLAKGSYTVQIISATEKRTYKIIAE